MEDNQKYDAAQAIRYKLKLLKTFISTWSKEGSTGSERLKTRMNISQDLRLKADNTGLNKV